MENMLIIWAVVDPMLICGVTRPDEWSVPPTPTPPVTTRAPVEVLVAPVAFVSDNAVPVVAPLPVTLASVSASAVRYPIVDPEVTRPFAFTMTELYVPGVATVASVSAIVRSAVPLKVVVPLASPLTAIVLAVVRLAADPVMFESVNAIVLRVGPVVCVMNRLVPFHSTAPAAAAVRLAPAVNTRGATVVVPAGSVTVEPTFNPPPIPTPPVTTRAPVPVVVDAAALVNESAAPVVDPRPVTDASVSASAVRYAMFDPEVTRPFAFTITELYVPAVATAANVNPMVTLADPLNDTLPVPSPETAMVREVVRAAAVVDVVALPSRGPEKAVAQRVPPTPTPPVTVNAPVVVLVDPVALVMERAVPVVAPRPVTLARVSVSDVRYAIVEPEVTRPFAFTTTELYVPAVVTVASVSAIVLSELPSKVVEPVASPLAAIVRAVVRDAAEPVMFESVNAIVFLVGPVVWVMNRLVPFHSTAPAAAAVRFVPAVKTRGATVVVPAGKPTVEPTFNRPPIPTPPVMTRAPVPVVVEEVALVNESAVPVVAPRPVTEESVSISDVRYATDVPDVTKPFALTTTELYVPAVATVARVSPMVTLADPLNETDPDASPDVAMVRDVVSAAAVVAEVAFPSRGPENAAAQRVPPTPTPPVTVRAPVVVLVEPVAFVMLSAVPVVAPRPVTDASVSVSDVRYAIEDPEVTRPFALTTTLLKVPAVATVASVNAMVTLADPLNVTDPDASPEAAIVRPVCSVVAVEALPSRGPENAVAQSVPPTPTPPVMTNAPVVVLVAPVALVIDSAVPVVAPLPVTDANVSVSAVRYAMLDPEVTRPFALTTTEL